MWKGEPGHREVHGRRQRDRREQGSEPADGREGHEAERRRDDDERLEGPSVRTTRVRETPTSFCGDRALTRRPRSVRRTLARL